MSDTTKLNPAQIAHLFACIEGSADTLTNFAAHAANCYTEEEGAFGREATSDMHMVMMVAERIGALAQAWTTGQVPQALVGTKFHELKVTV